MNKIKKTYIIKQSTQYHIYMLLSYTCYVYTFCENLYVKDLREEKSYSDDTNNL